MIHITFLFVSVLLCEASSGHVLRALLADARIRKHHCCVMGNGDRIARLAMGMFPGRIFCFVYLLCAHGLWGKGTQKHFRKRLIGIFHIIRHGMDGRMEFSLLCLFRSFKFNTLYRRIILLSILKISTLPVLSGLGTVLKLKAGAVHSLVMWSPGFCGGISVGWQGNGRAGHGRDGMAAA